jgi:hypothetical protein
MNLQLERTRTDRWVAPGLSMESAWSAVQAVARRVERVGNADELLKTALDGQPVTEDVTTFPGATETASAWIERMKSRAERDGTVYLYARELTLYDRRIFDALLTELGDLLQEHGLVRGNTDIEAFLGDYRVTPRGIHREQCGNSHLVLWGSKYMHLWHGEEWIPEDVARLDADGATAVDPEEYLPDVEVDDVASRGVSLLASAGQMFTWDAGTWHVGETVGPAFAVNIARYTKTFDARAGSYACPSSMRGEVEDAWLTGFRAFLGTEPSPQKALARASAYGLEPPAGSAGGQHADGHRLMAVLVPSQVPLLWHSTSDEVLVACYGQCVSAARASVAWIEQVATAAVGTVLDVPAADDAQRLAAFLVSTGALARVEAA